MLTLFVRACDYFLVKNKEQITYEDLKKLIAENKAVFIKSLVFVLACVLIYFVVPVFGWLGAAGCFLYDTQITEISVWILLCSLTIRSLWNWEL